MDLANTLENLVNKSAEDFMKIPEAEWTDRPNPGKWSKKEILGHLIDSAMNNLKRFNEIQFTNTRPYVIQQYRQAELVRANHYQELPIDHIITLWKQVNQQISYVLKSLTFEALEIAILTPEGDSKTVGWLAEDYVVHLQHHLDQIFGKR